MSRSGQVVAMMAGWWVVVATPTVLLRLGLFEANAPAGVGGDIDAEGGLVLLWVISYCVQVLVLVLLSRPVGHLSMWWLFMGSLLPWVVHYGAPYSLGASLVLLVLAAGAAVAVAVAATSAIRLDEHGRLVTAVVVREVPTRMTTVVNNIHVRRKVELDIPAADGSGSYRGSLTMLYEMGTRPMPGDQVRLRVDPDNPKRFAPATAS
ncbi:hypothetical protein [Nocardioides sp.]|uniref:hypothetical protein n=1 Tax=Nocardioides sp. TaxID=35761 RepID=UPI001A1EF0AF|nr:hypothetical protein [Nocardioides sp.]MBJ7359154.1 hypothetical protein [Nocardioides sp.]